MKLRTVLILLAVSVVISGAFLACASESAARPITNAAGQNVSGTATGSAPGYGGEVNVTVTIENGIITAVVVDAARETQAFAGPVVMRAPRDMIRFNAPEMDNVSGSTVTVMAVNQAARAAMDQLINQ